MCLVGFCHEYRMGLQVHVGPMRSASVGWLKLKSADPKDHPIIEPNYMSEGKSSFFTL